MLPEKDKGRIEGLNERLYSRTRYHNPLDTREAVTESDESAPADWQTPPIDDMLMSERRRSEPYPLIKKIFLVAALFCACAGIAAALIYFKGDNFISTKNLDISVEAPVTISAGSPVDMMITVKNGNNAALSAVDLNITYPAGTRSAADPTAEVAHTKETIDSLGAGAEITKPEKAVFLGSEGDVEQVTVSVDYKVAGSNAVFTKEKVFDMTIGSAPVSFSVSDPDSVTSGAVFSTTMSIGANSQDVLKNVILRAEYPYGWAQADSSPAPTGPDSNIWIIGDLSPGGKKTITLRGSLTGQDNEQRSFRFFVGSGKADGTFDTTLASDSVIITINRPLLDLGVKLNGESADEYAAPAGKGIQMSINYKNNLSATLLSPQIQVRLTGSALDRSSVRPINGGFYNSADNTVTWDASNDTDLATLTPGSGGSVTVNFSSLNTLPPGSSNQSIDLSAVLSGHEQDNNKAVSVSEHSTVKIASEVDLGAKSLYSVGPFSNIGPIPPKAETGTTYTVELDLGNTQNDVSNATVTGVLGANVTWLGEISPADAALTYDATSRTITWAAGTLPSGTGFSSPQRTAFFRVSLAPSLGQVGAAPVLVGNVAVSGTDSFTTQPVRVTAPAITTKISSDPSYVQGDEIVVK